MAPKRKATKAAVVAETESKQTAVMSQDANEIIGTKKPNKKTASKKNAKPETELRNDDNVDISPKKANQRPKRENAKKVTNYAEESIEEIIEPVKKKSRGKKAPADLVEENYNSENDKHIANNSTQDDRNKKKRPKKNAATDAVQAVEKGIVEEKPKEAKSMKLKKEENEQDVEVQAPLKRKPRIKAEKITDEVKVDKKKLIEVTEKTIDASPEKKSVKPRKAVKKEEKRDIEVKSSPAKKKKKQTGRITGRISTGGKWQRPKLAERRQVDKIATSNEDLSDTSQNFSSGVKHEPPKQEKTGDEQTARSISSEPRRKKKRRGISTGGKRPSKEDTSDTSQNFSSDDKHEPPKQEKTGDEQTARSVSSEPRRRKKHRGISTGGKRPSKEDTSDTSQNFSSDDEHEPSKELAVEKSGKRAAEDAKPNDTAVTKRIKIQKNPSEDKAKPKLKMNSTTTDYTKINFESDKEYTLKICSWNVAGLRALVAKNGFEYFEHEKPDIICLQEIKCLEDEVPSEAKLPGFHMYWCSKPGGRGGVALLTKKMPYNIEYNIGDDELDQEGRIITAEYSKFYLIVVYVPNAGRKLVNLERRLRWNKLFEQHVNKLKAIKPVVIVGDMNVAHNEIDLANPKTNTKNAGFSIEERNGMTDLLNHGFIDTFRHLYPEQKGAYTFWTYMGGARAKNVGWRLDYGIVTENLASKLVDNIIRSEILGSDHCPMLMLLNL